jgi:ferredoxin
MSVDIRILPDDRSGLVAEGTYLIDAARRMGVAIPSECGGTACESHVVIVEEGAGLLSSLTDSERRHLSEERLARGERLACQARLEKAGEVRIRLLPHKAPEPQTQPQPDELSKKFSEMSLDKKIRTLAQMEAMTAYQTIVTLADVPFKVAGKVLDVMAVRGRAMDRQERASRHSDSHDEDGKP